MAEDNIDNDNEHADTANKNNDDNDNINSKNFEFNDLDENPPSNTNPKLQSQSYSLQRPITELSAIPKKKRHSNFKANRKLIKKRLSAKMRIDFERIVQGGIHAGHEDEFFELKPQERSKKMLQLSRRFSHRPTPEEIQNDSDYPIDLKKAEKEYYKKYGNEYRNSSNKIEPIPPVRNRTSSDPNPPNKPREDESKDPENIKNGKKKFKRRVIDNPLDWKFGQRSSTKELQIRGIIPEQYADVVHGGKSLEEAKQEWESYKRSSSMKIKNKIDLKFRPTKKDLKDRNIIYDVDDYNDDPLNEFNKFKKNQKDTKKALKIKLKQRMQPDEADQRAIIKKDELFGSVDYKDHKKQKKRDSKILATKLNLKLFQRADPLDVTSRGIIHPLYMDNEPKEAKKKKREQRNSIIKEMDTLWQARPSQNEILERLKLSKDEYYNDSMPQPSSNPITIINPSSDNLLSPTNQYQLQTTPEHDEIDANDLDDGFPMESFLDRMHQQKKEISSKIGDHLRRRSTIEELQKQGILPMDYNPWDDEDNNGSDAEYVSDDDDRSPHSNSNKDNNDNDDASDDTESDDADDDDDDDNEFESFLDRMQDERRQHRESIEISHKRRPTREALMAAGIIKPGDFELVELDKKPQAYMSQEYAKGLNKARDSDDESRSHSQSGSDADEDEDESDDDDNEPTFLDRLHDEKKATKLRLEKAHRRRPTIEDLERKGIVEKGVYDDLQVALARKHDRKKSFTTQLAQFLTKRPDIAEALTKGLIKAEYIGLEPEKRKEIELNLDGKLNKKRRPSMSDLEMRGIVPSGYFTQGDATKAVSNKHQRRMTAEKELSSFLPKRMNPRKMMERGFIAQQQYQNIMGMTIPIPTMQDNDQMNKQQQAFSGGAMSVAAIFGRQMVRDHVKNMDNSNSSLHSIPIVTEPKEDELSDDDINQNEQSAHYNTARRNSNSRLTGIGSIVLELPQHAETSKLFNHENWTQNLYESLLSSLNFQQITRRLEQEIALNKSHANIYNDLTNIFEKYQGFERLYHTKMNSLQKDKKIILEQINICETEESESLSILSKLIIEHSSLEQKIRPQMKMLLHKMSLVENRYNKLHKLNQNSNLQKEYKHELHFYDTYITELKNVFIHTNNIRSQYQNKIRTVIIKKDELQKTLKIKDNELLNENNILYKKFSEFNALITSTLNKDRGHENDSDNINQNHNSERNESKYDPLASDPVTDLKSILDEKSKNIDTNLDLLRFRISTIPASDYAVRVMELCQLSYIYSNDLLKSFFEWFIRFAVETFVEINYGHTVFTTQNVSAIENELNKLSSIKFIAELTPSDNNNKSSFDNVLYSQLTLIVEYLELLPLSNDNNIKKKRNLNNNIDHEYVIFNVARYLTSDFKFSKEILSKNGNDLTSLARMKVNEWIKCILDSTKSNYKYNNNMTKIQNGNLNKPRNIIQATKKDVTAQIKPSRAASIVMSHVYGIHVQG